MDTIDLSLDTHGHQGTHKSKRWQICLESQAVCSIRSGALGSWDCWLYSYYLLHSVNGTILSQFTFKSSLTPPVLVPHFYGEQFLSSLWPMHILNVVASHHLHHGESVQAPSSLTWLPQSPLSWFSGFPPQLPYSLQSIQKPGILSKVRSSHSSTQTPPVTIQLTCKLKKKKALQGDTMWPHPSSPAFASDLNFYQSLRHSLCSKHPDLHPIPWIVHLCPASGHLHVLFPLYGSFFPPHIPRTEPILFKFLHKSPSQWGLPWPPIKNCSIPCPYSSILHISFHSIFSLGHTAT